MGCMHGGFGVNIIAKVSLGHAKWTVFMLAGERYNLYGPY